MDSFRYWLSARLFNWALAVIPDEPVRVIMAANVTRGAKQLEECLEDDESF
jgi:hypothetical protein